MKRLIARLPFAVILLCFALIYCTDKHAGKSLPRGIPEAEGVSSHAIITFLDSAADSSFTWNRTPAIEGVIQ